MGWIMDHLFWGGRCLPGLLEINNKNKNNSIKNIIHRPTEWGLASESQPKIGRLASE